MVQLSDFSVRQFTALHAISADTDWCYPARHLANTHICVKSISKQVHDRQRTVALKHRCKPTGALVLPGGPWTPHDLRRTGATMMGALGVRPEVIERCLNHTEPNKLIRIYQRQEMKPEQREAWQLLGNRLTLLMQSHSNVMILKAA